LTLGARERRLLGILAVLGAVGAVYRLWPLVFGAGRDETDVVAAARAVSARVELPELRLAERAVPPEDFEPGRDPFRFGTPPAPPPPPPPTAAELEAERLRREQAEAARQAAQAAQDLYNRTPHPPQVDIRFLGSFGPKNRRIAVFNDGTRIVNAVEGEILNGKFVVYKIGFESVDLKFVGFPNEPPTRLAAGAGGGAL
jgi:hypothetical protein